MKERESRSNAGLLRLQAAIVEYDQTAPARDALHARIDSEASFAEWSAQMASALERVQEAYYEATCEINSRDKCRLVPIEDARAFAAGQPYGAPMWSVPIEARI